MKKVILTTLLSIPVLFGGCDAFEYHPYDGRISGATDINAKNIVRIEKNCMGKDSIRFILMGDTQRHYDETEAFVKATNKRTDIDFVIHGGDISDFGVTKEFMWMRDIMNKLSVPYVALLGNHDCLGNGEEIYNKIFGKENFTFMAGNTKFVCLNTNAMEYDYSRPVPDFGFLEEEIEKQTPGHEKTVAVMHVKPYSGDFNNNVARVFHRALTGFPNLQFCLHAHEHELMVNDIFEDGIIYYGSDYIKRRSYLLFTITQIGYTYEVVNY